MPDNGSGGYTRAFTSTGWQDDRNNGIKIVADRHDVHDQDMANALTNRICKDGQTTTTARIPFAFGVSLSNGTVSSPAISGTGASANSGIYFIGTDNIGIAINGAKIVDTATTGVGVAGTLSATGVVSAGDGLQSAPGFAFAGELGSGAYRSGPNAWALIVGGGVVVNFTTSSVNANKDFTVNGSLTFKVFSASGNLDSAGTANFAGLVTAESNLQCNGNFVVGTSNNVVVTGSSGAISHAGTITPQVNDTVALGSATLGYTGLHFETGAEVRWRTSSSGANWGQVTINGLVDDVSSALPLTLGMVFIYDSEGHGAIYVLRGGSTATVELGDSGGTYINTDTDGNHCVFHNGSNYVIRNRRGATRSYRILYFEYVV
jgi:hypothetical protein